VVAPFLFFIIYAKKELMKYKEAMYFEQPKFTKHLQKSGMFL